MEEAKSLYKIWWLESPDKDGNRTIQYTTKRDTSMINAIQAVIQFFELDEGDIIQVKKETI